MQTESRWWGVDSSTEWLSWTKFIAMAAVVAIHTVGYNAVVDSARDTALGNAAVVVDAAAVFCVPVFVMASGALLLNPARFRGAASFYRKRASRLLPALVFWHAFYFAFRVVVLDEGISLKAYLVQAMNGQAYTGLYYFWIIIGLVAVVPLLIPWVARTRRRHVAEAGAAFAAMPALTVLTHDWRGGTDLSLETPWTWWIFYLGLFLLGWAFREVVLTRPWTVAAGCAIVTIALLLAWAWENPAAPSALRQILGGNYYGGVTCVYAVLIFVFLHSAMSGVRTGASLVRGRAGVVGRALGNGTLGVFVLHGAVFAVTIKVGLLGSAVVAPSAVSLAARYVVVLAVTYLIVLGLRRIPGARTLT